MVLFHALCSLFFAWQYIRHMLQPSPKCAQLPEQPRRKGKRRVAAACLANIIIIAINCQLSVSIEQPISAGMASGAFACPLYTDGIPLHSNLAANRAQARLKQKRSIISNLSI
jgi:hypothetical protein